jgi:hypothetical protein
MYCNNCGKSFPAGSKFCQFCGIKIQNAGGKSKLNKKSPAISNTEEVVWDKDTSPYPYVVSLNKFIILSITTLTLYETYWLYKQWKSLKAQKDLKISPIARAIFSPIFIFSFLGNVAQNLKSVDNTQKLYAGILGVAYILIVVMTGVPDSVVPSLPNWYWLLGMLSFVPLIPAVAAVNHYWEKKSEGKVVVSKFGISNYLWSIVGILVMLLVLYGVFGVDEKGNDKFFSSFSTMTTEASENDERWTKFTEKSKGFSVSLPKDPSLETDETGDYPLYGYLSVVNDRLSYYVSVVNYDDSVDVSNPKFVLDQVVYGFNDEDKKLFLVSSTATFHDGYPAKDYVVRENELIYRGRFILYKNALYQVVVTYYEEDGKPSDYDSFINSFSVITEKN